MTDAPATAPLTAVPLALRLAHLRPARPVCAVDLETTGPDPATARAVAVAAVRVDPSSPPVGYEALIDPGVPIPPAATAVHGITDADVRGRPPFAAIARAVGRLVGGAVVVAYHAPFDLLVLQREFARAGVRFRVAGRAVADPLAVFRAHEPRTLAGAVRFYLGREHTAAHSALADAAAALEVLDAQAGRYGLPADPDALARAVAPVDLGGRLAAGPDGKPVLGFGKHRGRPLAEVAATDPGYLRWALDALPLLDDARGLFRAALDTAAAPVR
ncbi:MAG: exonuclease domain-containing protein [Gemmataceae bacterium]